MAIVLVYLFAQDILVGQDIKDSLDYFKLNFKNVSSLNKDNQAVVGQWQNLAAETSMSSVGVQSFRDNKIIKQGSGLILSSDGLIITAYDNMPIGASVSQVFYGDKIYNPVVLARNYAKNLVLAKINAENLNASRLDQIGSIHSGEELLIVGLVPMISKSIIFSQRAMLSYVTDRDIVLDAIPNYYIVGSKVINIRGEVLGFAEIRSGKVTIVKSQDIDLMLKNYLNKVKR